MDFHLRHTAESTFSNFTFERALYLSGRNLISIRCLLMPILLFLLFMISHKGMNAQNSFFQPKDTLDKSRYYKALTFGSAVYAGFASGLYYAWYAQYPKRSFHLYNDFGEWSNVDKYGHIFGSYLQAKLVYQGARWTGLSKNSAMIHGIVSSALFQTTIEVMDGFNESWGFSIPDFVANQVGLLGFWGQVQLWGEQKFKIKWAASLQGYSMDPFFDKSETQTTSLHERAQGLFGSSALERLLKDYNGQSYWISFHPSSFGFLDRMPPWLNFSIGYSAAGLLGGYENAWMSGGANFDRMDVRRHHQFFLSLDLDLEKIKTPSPFLKGVMRIFNIFKYPAPTLEITTEGIVKFHLFKLG